MNLLQLIRKEFIVRFRRVNSSRASSTLALLGSVAGAILIVALVSVFTYFLDRKVLSIAGESSGYLTVLFLAILAAFICFDGALKMRRSLFSLEDRNNVFTLPFKSSAIVLSKAIFIWIYEVGECLLLSLPILIIYGINRGEPWGFYAVGLVYCLVIPFVISGISFLVACLFQFFYRLIKNLKWVQFLLASAVVVGLCFLYGFFLRLFLAALNQESGTDGGIPKSFIDGLKGVISYLYPVFGFMDAWLFHERMFVDILVLVLMGILLPLAGFYLCLAYYRRWDASARGWGAARGKIRVYPPFLNLVRKEMSLIFQDSASVFSYTSLLIMMPFLSYVVISSFNSIMSRNMSVVVSYFPALMPAVDVTMVLLFISIIDSSASLSLAREERALSVYKSLPVTPGQTIISKILVPSVLSSVSLILSCGVLGGLKELSIGSTFTALAAGLVLIVAENVLGIELDAHDRGEGKVRLSFLATVSALLVPFLVLLCALAGAGLGGDEGVVLGIVFGVVVLFSLVPLLLAKRLYRIFADMEVI